MEDGKVLSIDSKNVEVIRAKVEAILDRELAKYGLAATFDGSITFTRENVVGKLQISLVSGDGKPVTREVQEYEKRKKAGPHWPEIYSRIGKNANLVVRGFRKSRKKYPILLEEIDSKGKPVKVMFYTVNYFLNLCKEGIERPLRAADITEILRDEPKTSPETTVVSPAGPSRDEVSFNAAADELMSNFRDLES